MQDMEQKEWSTKIVKVINKSHTNNNLLSILYTYPYIHLDQSDDINNTHIDNYYMQKFNIYISQRASVCVLMQCKATMYNKECEFVSLTWIFFFFIFFFFSLLSIL